MATGGGAEEVVREVPELRHKFEWRVTRGGYYWLHRTPKEEGTILSYDFATRKTRPVLPGKNHYAGAWETFDVAPDVSWIIWPGVDPPVRRIMVADGFR